MIDYKTCLPPLRSTPMLSSLFLPLPHAAGSTPRVLDASSLPPGKQLNLTLPDTFADPAGMCTGLQPAAPPDASPAALPDCLPDYLPADMGPALHAHHRHKRRRWDAATCIVCSSWDAAAAHSLDCCDRQ